MSVQGYAWVHNTALCKISAILNPVDWCDSEIDYKCQTT